MFTSVTPSKTYISQISTNGGEYSRVRRSVVEQLEVVSKDGQPILITQNPIPEGSFIIQYTGEVMSSQSFQQRVASYGNRPTYCLPMTRDLVIDASMKGSVCR